MQANIERLRHALTEWLIVEEMLGDAKFFTPLEWTSRGETYCCDASLILVIDGSSLHTILNFGGEHTEFDELIESFGFYYELGESWYLGFYPIEGYNFEPVTGPYSDKLVDDRWLRKAAAVKERADHKCQDCGATAPLEAHHCYYAPMRHGFEPWEYPLNSLRALCRPCHKARESAEIRMRAFLARLPQAQIEALRDGLGHSLYWFQPDAFLEFMKSAHPDPEKLHAAFGRLTKFIRDGSE